MRKQIRIGIVGYGNLGRGVEVGIKNHPDMELVGIFSRRDPKQLKTNSPAYLYENIGDFKEKIDVFILCGGSKSDIPVQGPEVAEYFNTVDAFDTHAQIPKYFEQMNEINEKHETVSVLATGWDPGLFSLSRLLQEEILPAGDTYTFWGRGVSQGHSDAVRRVEGVRKAAQYTVPAEWMIDQIQKGKKVDYSAEKAHIRDVYVVLEDNADPLQVEEAIKTMPDYFEDYKTTVNYISEEEYEREHNNMAHGGRVMRHGNTSGENTSVIDFSLNLQSNPEFTAAVMLVYARAAYKLAKAREFGARTVLDIPPHYLSARSREDLIGDLL